MNDERADILRAKNIHHHLSVLLSAALPARFRDRRDATRKYFQHTHFFLGKADILD